jgi:hypothetical protein
MTRQLWRKTAEIFPAHDGYRAKAGREIPPVIVERV